MTHRLRYIGPAVVVLAIVIALFWRLGGAGPRVESASAGEEAPAFVPLFESTPRPAVEFPSAAAQPIVVPNCRLGVFEKQDVCCQRDGKIMVIGTEVGPNEPVPEDRLFRLETPQGVRRFRRLKEGDVVVADQVLGILDDRLARAEAASKKAKVAAARADLDAAEKTYEEAREKFQTQLRLSQMRSTSNDEVRSAKLVMDRTAAEATSKKELVTIAELERQEADIVVRMHEIRTSVPGVVKSVLKKLGEGAKSLEMIFQVHDYSRLRVEGLLEAEYLPYVHLGTKAVAEHVPSFGPVREFRDHLSPVTGVAVHQRDGKTTILSASDDGTVRLHDPETGTQRAVFRHPCAVKSLACASAAAADSSGDLCLAGGADGRIRVWNLVRTGMSETPDALWEEGHRGAVACIAVSPDGRFCASGGEDREIAIWDVRAGRLRYRLPSAHRAAVTSLQFSPEGLVSAGRDGTLRIWKLGSAGAEPIQTLDRRSGDVAFPGISRDGRHVLFDQGRSLRLMRLADGANLCLLESPGETSQFSTFALLSPDQRLMATACASEGLLHLWRTPTKAHRASKVRSLVTRQLSTPTCGSFAPDGSLFVTGSKENQVLVWPTPAAADLDRDPNATITLLEQAVESGSRHVRIWAEVANPEGRLLPGTTVDLALYPR